MSDPSSVAREDRGRIGELLDERYRIVDRLGSGGMGHVYLAEHVVVGRRFAVKFLRADFSHRRDLEARFRREARAAGHLASEHVAAVVDFGFASDGVPFLVMEYLEGTNLAELVRRQGPLPVPRAVAIMLQAGSGIGAAHHAGIIHRDLKPANLFLSTRTDGTDWIKVLDFGVAKVEDDDAEKTKTGSVVGTPHYMSPEQARGDKDLDLRVDVYALGLILYEMLGGEKAHPGDGRNEVLYRILTKTPTPLEDLREGVPEGLLDVVHQAMAFDREDRFETVEQLAVALLPFAGPGPVPFGDAGKTGLRVSSSEASTGVHASGVASAASSKLSRPVTTDSAVVAPVARPPRSWGSVVGAAGALAAISAVGWALFGGDGETPGAVGDALPAPSGSSVPAVPSSQVFSKPTDRAALSVSLGAVHDSPPHAVDASVHEEREAGAAPSRTAKPHPHGQGPSTPSPRRGSTPSGGRKMGFERDNPYE